MRCNSASPSVKMPESNLELASDTILSTLCPQINIIVIYNHLIDMDVISITFSSLATKSVGKIGFGNQLDDFYSLHLVFYVDDHLTTLKQRDGVQQYTNGNTTTHCFTIFFLVVRLKSITKHHHQKHH